ncbi:MAG: helix-turn-helix domain-containing protein [Clostridia bacterium]|nr:helix-turn-helix domain-containing protein [Clostridia bacterium]
MLNENIKTLRTQKGLTQEELAVRVNVVRQTVSKWEKGLSVPDSEMLIRLAELFEVPVGSLLGETLAAEENKSELAQIAAKLEQLNALMAERNARSRTVLRIVAGCLIAIAAVVVISILIPLIQWLQFMGGAGSLGIIGGADGPTSIYIASSPDGSLWVTVTIAVLIIAALVAVAVLLLRRARKR